MKNQSNKNNPHKKTIYYDGSCPMCTAIIGKVAHTSQKGKFSTQDITHVQLPHHIKKEQALEEIHVIRPDGKTLRNAEAILSILEEYPRWRIVVMLGKMPIVKSILPFVYRYIAKYRHFLFGHASRIYWVRITVVLALITGLLLSLPLWTGERFYPLAPVIEQLPILHPIVQTILLTFLLSMLVGIVIFPKKHWLIVGTLLIIALFVFFDQIRLQPYTYQYFFMLATIGLFTWNYRDTNNGDAVLNTLRLIIVSIYFYSGLQKLNPMFLNEVMPWMVGPIAKLLPQSLSQVPYLFGQLIPFIEIGIGIGLLFKILRRYAVIIALLMHLFILYVLSPLGHNWNSIVWPWNIAMMVFTTLLFWKINNFSSKEVIWTKNFLFQKIILLLFIVMPALSFFNLWDSLLSSALYSANLRDAQIIITDSVEKRLPREISQYITPLGQDKYEVDYFNWSFDELNVPPFHETRGFKSMARSICSYADSPDDVVLINFGKPTIFNSDTTTEYNCSKL